MDCIRFILSIRTQKKFTDVKNFEDFFDSSNLDKNHEIFSEKK